MLNHTNNSYSEIFLAIIFIIILIATAEKIIEVAYKDKKLILSDVNIALLTKQVGLPFLPLLASFWDTTNAVIGLAVFSVCLGTQSQRQSITWTSILCGFGAIILLVPNVIAAKLVAIFLALLGAMAVVIFFIEENCMKEVKEFEENCN